MTHVDTIALACALAAEDPGPGQRVMSVADEPAAPFGETLRQLLEKDRDGRLRTIAIPGWTLSVAATLVEARWRLTRQRGEPVLTRDAVAYVTHERVLDTSAWRGFQSRAG